MNYQDESPPVLSFDVIFDIFDMLNLSLYELAPYRICCRGMKEIMPRLVKKITADGFSALRTLNENWVLNLTQMYPYVEVLQFSGVDIVDDDTANLVSKLHYLKSVDFFNCTAVGDGTITALVENCLGLCSLTLGGSLRRHGANVTNPSIHFLSEQAHSLNHLHLTSCYQLTDEAIVSIGTHRGLHLQSISLSRCARVTDSSIIQLAKKCPNLESVSVNECFRLTSEAVIALASSCQQLRSVNVRGTRVTDTAIEALAMQCPLLEAVNLECCLNLTDAGVMTLGSRANRPADWNGQPYTQQSPSSSSIQPPSSSSSSSSSASSSPQMMLPPPPRSHSAVQSSSSSRSRSESDELDEFFAMRLRTLSVSGCVRLTDASIVSVAQSCHNLATVDLSQVYDLTDASVVALASNCGPHLRSLKLSRCGRITDYAIAAVAKCCPGLRSVWVDDCYGLTDAAIDALARNCSLLDSIDMSHCAKLTNESIFSVCAHCRRLHRIEMKFPQTSLGGPSLLTSDAVIALAEHVRQPGAVLRFIDLTGHPRLLTPEASKAIALAEQPSPPSPPPLFGNTEDNAGGGGGGGGGDVYERHERFVFLIDDFEEEEKEELSFYHGVPFSNSEAFDFTDFSNGLPPGRLLHHGSSSEISNVSSNYSNSDSMKNSDASETGPISETGSGSGSGADGGGPDTRVVSFSLPSDNPLEDDDDDDDDEDDDTQQEPNSPPPPQSQSPQSRRGSGSKSTGKFRGRAKSFMLRSFKMFGSSSSSSSSSSSLTSTDPQHDSILVTGGGGGGGGSGQNSQTNDDRENVASTDSRTLSRKSSSGSFKQQKKMKK